LVGEVHQLYEDEARALEARIQNLEDKDPHDPYFMEYTLPSNEWYYPASARLETMKSALPALPHGRREAAGILEKHMAADR
tara:strand:- start:476 stop:718 length:243 start_codon:yes stop_codon:yes gene_type:complete